jgi:probable phosphoglycerate mutase
VSDSGVLPPEGFRTRGPLPSGTRLVLVRHGEAYCNANGIVGGPQGCGGLTALGIRQAEALRDRLARSGEFDDADAFYTSTLPRAVETGAIISSAMPSSLNTVADCTLCELHPGAADAMTWNQLVETYGAPDWDNDPTAPLAPGGESWTGFYERCVSALRALVERHPSQLVVVVCHGGVIEQALKLVYGRSGETRLRLRTQNCSMTEVEYRDDAWHLLRYNDLAPLTRL